MDLGLSSQVSALSHENVLTEDEIRMLLNPENVPVMPRPSALQVLLNRGAEYLAQSKDSSLPFIAAWQTGLKALNPNFKLNESGHTKTVENALVYQFRADNQPAAIILDKVCVFLLLDALLGGGNDISVTSRSAQYSEIEKNVLAPVLEQLVQMVGDSVGSICSKGCFSETVPTGAGNTYVLQSDMATGTLQIQLPEACAGIQEEYLFLGHEAEILRFLNLKVMAKTMVKEASLQQVRSWQVGTQIMLDGLSGILQIGAKTVAEFDSLTDNKGRQITIKGAK